MSYQILIQRNTEVYESYRCKSWAHQSWLVYIRVMTRYLFNDILCALGGHILVSFDFCISENCSIRESVLLISYQLILLDIYKCMSYVNSWFWNHLYKKNWIILSFVDFLTDMVLFSVAKQGEVNHKHVFHGHARFFGRFLSFINQT